MTKNVLLDKDTAEKVMYHIEEFLRLGNRYGDIESLCNELKKRYHDLEEAKELGYLEEFSPRPFPKEGSQSTASGMGKK